MKKLLSFLAAGALALGLIGCSGDLHDEEYNPISLDGYVISGGWDAWTGNLLEGLSGTSAVLENVSPADDGAKLIFCPNNASVYISTLSAGTLPEGVSIGSVDNGFGGKNPTIDGLKKGYTYKISLDTSKGVAEVSVEITDAPEPAAEVVPSAEKLVVFCGSFGTGSTPVVWDGNVGTAVIEKGTSLKKWETGYLEGAIAEDSSWKGKFCGVELKEQNTSAELEYASSNIVIYEFKDKDVADKTVRLTFTIVPEGTWKGEKNAFTSKTTIEVSYSLSD